MSVNAECVECGRADAHLPVRVRDEDTEDFICHACIQTSRSYGLCRYCDDEAAYPISELNASGECPVHYGESVMDPEDEEGWDDNIQRWNEE